MCNMAEYIDIPITMIDSSTLSSVYDNFIAYAQCEQRDYILEKLEIM